MKFTVGYIRRDDEFLFMYRNAPINLSLPAIDISGYI